jgi:hypothetical protein
MTEIGRKTILINLDTSMQTPLESTKNAYPPSPSLPSEYRYHGHESPIYGIST